LYRASQMPAPAPASEEALDDGDIVVEDMVSRPPSAAPPGANGNGAHSLDAALAPPSDALSAALSEPEPEPEPAPAPRRSERPRKKSEAPAPPASSPDDLRASALEDAIKSANAKIRDLESALEAAQH